MALRPSPSEADHQLALSSVTTDTVGVARFAIRLGPFGGTEKLGPLLYPRATLFLFLVMVGALALRAFWRRDL